MTNQEILSHIDHTQLKPYAAMDDIKKLCDEAVKYKTASVCIPPCYVKRVKNLYGSSINICTVIGFPLGYSVKQAKISETKKALEDGASEIDMVINISDVKNGLYENILDEISELKKVVGNKVLKVIIETCYLTDNEKIKLCEIITESGADYIKTSTGFGTAGAAIEDIRLFKRYIGPNVKIKAAGGIKSIEDLKLFLKEGCDRIGTSSAVNMLKDNIK